MPKRNRPRSARSNWTPTPSRSCADSIASNCSGRALLRMGRSGLCSANTGSGSN
jgi:hypothetical protein